MNAERGKAWWPASISGLYCQADVTDEASVDAALAEAREAHGQERVLVNCAGIAIGHKTAARDRKTGAIEPHPLAAFSRVVAVNLIGTFHMIAKSAPPACSPRPGHARRRPRGHRQHRLGGGQRRPDRPGGLCGLEGRGGEPDASRGARPRPRRHPLRHHSAGAVRHPDGGRPARGGAQGAGRQHPVSLAPGLPPRIRQASWPTSSTTTCSTARPSASTAPCAWRRGKAHPLSSSGEPKARPGDPVITGISGEYWVARSSRAMTGRRVTRLSRRAFSRPSQESRPARRG
jgi:hypothetical protein